MNQWPEQVTIPPFGTFTLDEFEVYGIACSNYESQVSIDGITVEVVLHPPKYGSAEWDQFLSQCTALIPDIVANRKRILATGIDKLVELFTSYDPELGVSTIHDLVAELNPEMLQIHCDDDDEMSFSPTSHFPSLDLFVSFDADLRVTKVRFDG